QQRACRRRGGRRGRRPDRRAEGRPRHPPTRRRHRQRLRRRLAVKVLVANLGSTSFKYRLYDMEGETEQLLARGGIERIGSNNAKVSLRTLRGEGETVQPIADHGDAV